LIGVCQARLAISVHAFGANNAQGCPVQTGIEGEAVADFLSPVTASYYPQLAGFAPRRISVMRNDRVVAAKPKGTVTFHVDGVARFTVFRRKDCSDRSNKLVGR
jgi:hypothetical protein